MKKNLVPATNAELRVIKKKTLDLILSYNKKDISICMIAKKKDKKHVSEPYKMIETECLFLDHKNEHLI